MHDGTTRLVGSVSDEDGDPILTAVVRVNDSDREATTNNIGSYNLELEPGMYEVTVSADRFESKTWTQELPAGQWTRRNVVLTRLPTEVEGTVTNPDDEPVQGATVRVAGTDREATTGENGSYAFEIDPGSYSLETSAEGYNTRRSSVTVRESQVTTRDVQLSDGGRSDGKDEERDADAEDESEENDGESNSEADGDDEDGRDDTEHDESADGGSGDGETAAESSSDSRDDDSSPATNREQVLTLLFFAGTFLAAMIAAATVGLYRNRSR
ncbi:carboxypeptidase-like regulatory domain-containing protein [Natronorubrum sp. DTA7]|uniref:carboxypeptidase-like regulatory domain-containing protein n=1 Tax=Natronorubrum sp. DTA7 TaxID=3447016 RepID=UPI003F8671F9